MHEEKTGLEELIVLFNVMVRGGHFKERLLEIVILSHLYWLITMSQ